MLDNSILSELKNKEKELSQMLENFQPNLNMFGSNVFSSIETGSMMKRSLPYNPETIHAVKYVGNKED
jgi:hypothetical protein